uniref:Uncharacterized protein n=1 Tax=Micrurus surinamensis TaxID=129470 RepID=A0A2D4P137_MICSU
MDYTWKDVNNALTVLIQWIGENLQEEEKLQEEKKEKKGFMIKKRKYGRILVGRALKEKQSIKDKKRGESWVNGKKDQPNNKKAEKNLKRQAEKREGSKLEGGRCRKWMQWRGLLNVNQLILFLAYKDTG